MQPIYSRIATLIKRAKVPRRRASIEAGLSPAAIQNLIDRKGSPSLPTAAALARTFGVPEEWLVHGVGDDPDPSVVKTSIEAAWRARPPRARKGRRKIEEAS